MKTIITTLALFFTCLFSNAQIFGDNDVCAGNTYTYSASLPGAVTYSWTFPPGWYNVTVQGAGIVSATSNINAGDIYCECLDAGGNSMATFVLVTQFGGGAAVGWDVQPQNTTVCGGSSYTLNVNPNGSGSGSCPNGCGNGIAVANTGYAVYDNVWPNGNFIGFANGSNLPIPFAPGSYTYYIYFVDYTNGTNTAQAVRIEGSCGTATVNNVAQFIIPPPTIPGFFQMPDPVCIGDTVTVWASSGNGSFTPIMGITILNQGGGIMTAVVNSMPARASYDYIDYDGCLVSGICYINICAQTPLNGDSVVCAGHTYNYSANIAGAVTYDWQLPAGWYDIAGQGTPNITATCNANDGWIVVSGHDASGANVGVQQLETQFSAGGGWDVSPQLASGCLTDQFQAYVFPNSSGGGAGCPSGCGLGALHPNIVYGVFSDVWGSALCTYIMSANSSGSMGYNNTTLYVYQVDISNGTATGQPILIEGGCGNAVINNTISMSVIIIDPVFQQTPTTACIGDTVTLNDISGLWNFYSWSALADCIILNPNSDTTQVVITGINPQVNLITGCGSGNYNIAISTCAIPSPQFASSDTVFCDKQSIDFIDLSTNNPTSWQWFFPGAQPDTSTAQNPIGIYYPTSGSFDVTLIACNVAGCDTLTLNNFIVEYLAPNDSIFELNDTLFSFPASTYQWYEVGTGLISGATDQYYIPLQNGNYYCVITDSVGCSGPSNTIAITTGILNIVGSWQLAITPNPNSGIFKLEFNSTLVIGNLNIQIINVLGEIVFENKLEQVSDKFSQQINLSTASKGVYLLKLTGDEKVFTQKTILN